MADTIETINGSVVQHGHYNDRIYLMRLNRDDIGGTLATLTKLAKSERYGKLFARIPLAAWPAFKTAGFQKEAVIPGFYRGQTDGLFVARYFSAQRQVQPNAETLPRLPDKRDRTAPTTHPAADSTSLPVEMCNLADTGEMSGLFQQVFESYPFPICDPAYLKQAMAKGVPYYCIRTGDGITALAAAEIDRECQAVEMTDFAILPAWRKYGMATALLRHMENETRPLGIKTAYTIARAASPGINRLFQGRGYQYAGLLINNTQISGRIQSMSVWYKTL
jgi:putative beta-lysine N-acetyltransferase